MEFSRQEFWTGLLFPSPGDLPNPGIKPRSPTLQEDSLPTEPPGKPNYGGGNEDKATSFKRSHACTVALGAPDPAADHHRPRPPSETPGHSQASCISLLWGHCSFLLGSGVHKVLFLSSKGLFPQSWLSSGGSVVGLMATSSKRTYAIPKSAAPRAPAPAAAHC